MGSEGTLSPESGENSRSGTIRDLDALGCTAVYCLQHSFHCVLADASQQFCETGDVSLVLLLQRSKSYKGELKSMFSDSIYQTISSVLHCFASTVYWEEEGKEHGILIDCMFSVD